MYSSVEFSIFTVSWNLMLTQFHNIFITAKRHFIPFKQDIMGNAELDEAQAGNKVAGRSINNLRHADDTTLMAEKEEKIKSLLMKVKEENEKAGLKLTV